MTFGVNPNVIFCLLENLRFFGNQQQGELVKKATATRQQWELVTKATGNNGNWKLATRQPPSLHNKFHSPILRMIFSTIR